MKTEEQIKVEIKKCRHKQKKANDEDWELLELQIGVLEWVLQ